MPSEEEATTKEAIKEANEGALILSVVVLLSSRRKRKEKKY